MAWNDCTLTLKGLELMNRSVGEGTLELDYATGGAGISSVISLMMQTEVADQRQTFPFGGKVDLPAGKRLKIMITSKGLSTGYTMRQLGIWGHIGSEESSLVAILQDPTGIPIYAEADFPDFAVNFYAVIAVQAAANVAVNVNTSALVSLEGLSELGAVPLSGTSVPGATTPGAVGQRYIDTAAQKEYVCMGRAEDGTYLWIAVGGDVAWDEIGDKPTVFPPSSHSHAWSAITGKPSSFTPSAHNHAASEITSGVLSTARGGTGASSLSALASSLAGQGMCKIATGSYTGNGLYGADHPCSITLDFSPKLVVVSRNVPTGYAMMIAIRGISDTSTYYESGWVQFACAKVSWRSYELSWYASDDSYHQLNINGTVFRYVAIG